MEHSTNFETISFQELQNRHSTHHPLTEIDWPKHFEAIGLQLRNSDTLSVDHYFFKEYIRIMTTLSKQRFDPLSEKAQKKFIHFMYLMRDEIINWSGSLNVTPRNIISTKCLKYMPIKKGIIQEILEKRLVYQTSYYRTVFEAVHNELKEEIRNSWLNEATKRMALQRLDEMEIQLPGIYSSKNNFAEEISYEFAVTSCGLRNFINYNKAQIQYKLGIYQRRNSGRRSSGSGTMVKRDIHLNSRHSKKYNKIETVAEHLLLPLFSPNAPTAWNYGHLAFFIGHELSHTLEYIYDDPADFRPNDKMGKHVNCYITQMNKHGSFQYRTEDHSIKKRQIQLLRETIADSVGLKVAYKALMTKLDKNRKLESEHLPGYENLNAKKLFFTSFATLFCQNPLRPHKEFDGHPPNDIRVIMAASNLKIFATTYGCRANSPMNPNAVCDIWDRLLFSQETAV